MVFFSSDTVVEDESHVHHSMEQTIFSSASYTSWMMLCTITIPFHMYPCPAIRDTLNFHFLFYLCSIIIMMVPQLACNDLLYSALVILLPCSKAPPLFVCLFVCLLHPLKNKNRVGLGTNLAICWLKCVKCKERNKMRI